MMPQKIKAIVTNKSAMLAKYGKDGWQIILGALNELIRYDEIRGIDTRIEYLDDKTLLGDKAVKVSSSREQNKRAFDELYHKVFPYYTMILGADDIVPFQYLKNPAYSPQNRLSENICSDLPYACEAGYSTKVDDFLNPTRIVSRIPDIKGNAEKGKYVLCITIENILNIEHITQNEYGVPWAACTSKRTKPMRMTLRDMFDEDISICECPPMGPVWLKNEYSRKIHFHILHGGKNRNTLYNENLEQEKEKIKQKPAVLSDSVDGNIEFGTIVLERACHGGQLYNPNDGQDYKTLPLANMYMRSGAAAMLGSLTTNFSNRDGQKLGDFMMAGFYLCLNNCSTGEAFLTARQNVCQKGRIADLADKCMFAAYVMYGDPSLVPMADELFDEVAYNTLPYSGPEAFEAKDFSYIGQEIPGPVPPQVTEYIAAYLKTNYGAGLIGTIKCNAVVEKGAEIPSKFRFTAYTMCVYGGGEPKQYEEPEKTWFVFETSDGGGEPLTCIGQYVI